MSLKNELQDPQWSQKRGEKPLPYSLRLRLILWYGLLMLLTLSIFSILVFILARNTFYKSTQDALEVHYKYALNKIYHNLNTAGTNNWEKKLQTGTIETYNDPGLMLIVYDASGKVLYTSSPEIVGSANQLSTREIQSLVERRATTEQTFDGTHSMIEAIAIKAPANNAGHQETDTGPVIGSLVVVKPLSDIDQTLLILQSLLLVSGITALAGALMCSWIISANVLKPLSAIVQTARTITTTARGTHLGDLHQRVPRPNGQDEMAQVVDTFNDMLSALESSSQAQRRFIADASHELRAPLTTIQGNLAFLEHHEQDLAEDERHIMLSDAHEEALRLSRLVDELLLLARADAHVTPASGLTQESRMGAQENKPAAVELDHIVLQLVRQLRGRMNQDETAVTLLVGPIEPVRVLASEEDIRRILLILLDNAIKYTSVYREDGTGQVQVSIAQNEKGALLRVQDNGMGIAEEDLPHIFERFYRADQARSREGTGLGLSIAQTLVEQMGGQISAESGAGKGSTFIVEMPTAS